MALNQTLKIPTKYDRNMKICELRVVKNMTITDIADVFGITKQRVQAILERDLDIYFESKKK